jgi:hypothetical protein
MTVTFKTTREDFALNLQNLKIAHLTIFFARKDGATFEIPVNYLRFVPADEPGEIHFDFRISREQRTQLLPRQPLVVDD